MSDDEIITLKDGSRWKSCVCCAEMNDRNHLGLVRLEDLTPRQAIEWMLESPENIVGNDCYQHRLQDGRFYIRAVGEENWRVWAVLGTNLRKVKP